jgi:hypothetical protein
MSTRLRAGRFGVRIPPVANYFYLFSKVLIGCGAHPASYSMGTRVISRRYRVIDQSLPHSAKDKNEWRYTSTPPIYLHGDLKFHFKTQNLL